MNNCTFCKIVNGEIPSVKIWEDENFISIIDKFPSVEGQVLVIPKKHMDSKMTNLSDEDYTKLMIAAKKVAKFIEEKLKIERAVIVAEGLGVDHAHIKLYPVNSTKINECHITTKMGEEKTIEELNKIAEIIKK